VWTSGESSQITVDFALKPLIGQRILALATAPNPKSGENNDIFS
jgi:hypothetical protein